MGMQMQGQPMQVPPGYVAVLNPGTLLSRRVVPFTALLTPTQRCLAV